MRRALGDAACAAEARRREYQAKYARVAYGKHRQLYQYTKVGEACPGAAAAVPTSYRLAHGAQRQLVVTSISALKRMVQQMHAACARCMGPARAPHSKWQVGAAVARAAKMGAAPYHEGRVALEQLEGQLCRSTAVGTAHNAQQQQQ